MKNNYIKNFSFDADRKNIPSDNKPAQTYLKGWSFDIIKGNKVVQGGSDSPVLNAKNTATDREIVMGISASTFQTKLILPERSINL